MLSRMNVNGGVWGLEDATDLHCNNDENLNLPTFKAMLDAEEWFTSHSNANNNDITIASMNNANSHPEGPCFNIDMKDFGCYSSLVNPNPEPPNMLLQHTMNSCSSSPTSIFSLDPSQVQSFLGGGATIISIIFIITMVPSSRTLRVQVPSRSWPARGW